MKRVLPALFFLVMLLVPSRVLAVVINEFVVNATPEWVEFQNTDLANDVLMTYWIDDDTDFASDSGSSAKQSLASLNSTNPTYPFITVTSLFNNSGDSVVLFDATGNVVDQHVYASDPGAGVAIGRDPDGTGDFAVLGTATQGSPNSVTPSPTSEPSPTPSSTPTPTEEPSPTPSPTETPTPTLEPSPTPTNVPPTPTLEPSPTPTNTPTPTATPSPTITPSPTPTTEPSPTPTNTPTVTPSPTTTPNPTPTNSPETPTPTPTPSAPADQVWESPILTCRLTYTPKLLMNKFLIWWPKLSCERT